MRIILFHQDLLIELKSNVILRQYTLYPQLNENASFAENLNIWLI